MAFLGTAGFALFCGERKKFVPVAALGGVICWGTYLMFDYVGAGLFFSSLFSAVFAAIFGEVCARILKAPAVIFFTPAVIALIPGRTLYYCAAAMVDNNFALAVYQYGGGNRIYPVHGCRAALPALQVTDMTPYELLVLDKRCPLLLACLDFERNARIIKEHILCGYFQSLVSRGAEFQRFWHFHAYFFDI